MWNYIETDAYNSISLHDCRTDDIQIDGDDLVINFPDGFWITPVSEHINHHTALKTGPSQLRIYGFLCDDVIGTVSGFFKGSEVIVMLSLLAANTGFLCEIRCYMNSVQ